MAELATWYFGPAGLNAASDLRGHLGNYFGVFTKHPQSAAFAVGSRNLMPYNDEESRPFRGLTSAGTASGGRQMVTLKDSWGSLDDDGATPGKGSLFSTVADMLVYIGQGQVRVEGTSVAGALASNLLRFLLKWHGSYTDPKSGPYVAGYPEPSAPRVGIVDGDLYGAPNLSGTVSIKYARLSSITGDKSRASETSDVLVVSGNAIWATVSAALTGQTHHVFFGTKTILGGIGLHYRIAKANPFTGAEYTEADVERQTTITSITGGDKLNAAVGTFSAGDIGKLVEGVSGLTIAAGTVVAEVISSSQIRLSAAVSSGALGVVTLVAYAGLVRRSVVLNWTPSDLVEETAWIYDFPPPTGSHAFQLDNRMWVAAYADAAAAAVATPDSPDASASASLAGTALCPSIPDNFGSYDPRFPVYIPEAVVDILSDGTEGYKFIGGRNGVYAIMSLNVDGATPATLQVLIRGEGITSARNWCARSRAIYLYTAKGSPVRIVEGGDIDRSFASPVRHLMAGWDPVSTVVVGKPGLGGGVFYLNGNDAIFWDESTERWSTNIGINDYAAGVVVSAVATQARCLLTLENAGVRTAYYVDEDPSNGFVVGIGHFQDGPMAQAHKAVQQLTAEGVADRIDKNAWVGLHANTLKTFVTDAAMTTGSNVVTSAQVSYSAELEGSFILVRDAGPGGRPVWGRIKGNAGQITVVSPTGDLATAAHVNASATVSARYALLAYRIFPVKLNRVGSFEVDSREMYLPGFFSYAVSMMIETNGNRAQPLQVALQGLVSGEQGWTLPSSGFDQTV